MKVEDLTSLSSKIIAYARKQATVEYFQNFLNLLQQTLRGNPERPVSEHKNNLFSSLRSFDQISLTYGEKNLFHLLSYDNFVGSKAITEIEDILHDEKFDPVGVLQNIEKKFIEFKEFIERNQTVQSALQLFPAVQETYVREGEALLEITFSDEASVDNIVDFEWIDGWTKNIRAFSALVGEKPESTRIVSIQKSPPMIIALATTPVLAIALGKTINMVLVMAEKYLRIRAWAGEIRKLNLENTKIAQDLMTEAETFLEKSVCQIAGKLTAEIKPKYSFEVANNINLTVKRLFAFVNAGGRVDCPYTTDGTQTEDIADTYKEISMIKSIISDKVITPALQLDR